MVCFGAGMTTRAFFQNSGSVGRASGSLSMARRIWRSLSERRRFQSVPFLTEVFPVQSSVGPSKIFTASSNAMPWRAMLPRFFFGSVPTVAHGMVRRSSQQARYNLFRCATKVVRYVSQYPPDRSGRERLMVWHGDMMFAAHPSRHPDVTACLARLLIAGYIGA